jgi:mono/diheme cytochrome c family protein
MLLGVLFFGGVSATAQRPSVAIESLTGRDSYEFYCASCHGQDGRGDGPVADALRLPPADLTTMAYRNHDVFPREEVRKYITGTGRAISAHGPSGMPVWGPIFRAFESDARVRVRLDNLIDYLERLQVRTARVKGDPPGPSTE